MTDTTPDQASSTQRAVPFVPFADQAMYLAHVAAGQHSVMQFLWRYRRPVDRDGLLRFRDHRANGRLARLIRQALLPLLPFVPKRAFRAAGSRALGALSELPVTCSHLGTWPMEALQIDGTTADLFCFRGIDRGVTVRAIEERQGVASLIAAVIPDFIILNFVAYQRGVVTGSHELRILVERLLARYGLAGELFDA